jgi:hypothetical protein
MLPLETKQSGNKLLPHSDRPWGRGGVLGETSCSRRFKKKGHHRYNTGTWNVRTLNREGKLENFKKEMQKNEVSVLSDSEV